MPVYAVWDDEGKTILHLRFVNHWTWEELFETGLSVVTMCLERPHRVDIISDMMASSYRPPHFAEETNRLLSQSDQPPNMKIIVLIVDDFQQRIFQSYSQSENLTFTYAFAPGLDEARQLIAAARRGEPLPAYFPANSQLN